jgi:hypothetical protein
MDQLDWSVDGIATDELGVRVVFLPHLRQLKRGVL